MARPTKCNQDVAKALASDLKLGLTFEIACQRNGISTSAAYDWKARGERGETPFCEFTDTVKRAESEGELALVKVIQSAAELPKNWTAAAWLLERRFPVRWARKQIVVTQPDDLIAIEQQQSLSPEARKAKLEELDKLRKQDEN